MSLNAFNTYLSKAGFGPVASIPDNGHDGLKLFMESMNSFSLDIIALSEGIDGDDTLFVYGVSLRPGQSGHINGVDIKRDESGQPYKMVTIPTSELVPTEPVGEKIRDPEKVKVFLGLIEDGKKLDPLHVSKNKEILDGHHRFTAASIKGVPSMDAWEQIPGPLSRISLSEPNGPSSVSLNQHDKTRLFGATDLHYPHPVVYSKHEKIAGIPLAFDVANNEEDGLTYIKVLDQDRIGSKLVGYISARNHPDHLAVEHSYLSGPYRGTGIGRRMYEHLIGAAHALGKQTVQSDINVTEGAGKVWKRLKDLGYHVTGGPQVGFRIDDAADDDWNPVDPFIAKATPVRSILLSESTVPDDVFDGDHWHGIGPHAGAWIGDGEVPDKFYHGTTKDFDKFGGIDTLAPGRGFDKLLGTHIARDHSIADTFTHGGWAQYGHKGYQTPQGKVIQDGGRILPLKVWSRGTYRVPSNGGSDQQSILVDAARKVFDSGTPEAKSLWVDWVMSQPSSNSEWNSDSRRAELEGAYDSYMAGKSHGVLHPANHNLTRREADLVGGKNWVSESYANGFEGNHYSPASMIIGADLGGVHAFNPSLQEAHRKLAKMYVQHLQRGGHDVIEYENTSPEETRNAVDKSSHIVFDPRRIKGYYNQSPTIGDARLMMSDNDGVRAWHSDSHPITKNPDGSPKVYYHGTPEPGFDQFGSAHDSSAMRGTWVGEDPKAASQYTVPREDRVGFYDEWKPSQVGGIYPLHVKLVNPFIGSIHGDPFAQFGTDDKVADRMMLAGYDGYVSPWGHICVFKPEAMKSPWNKQPTDDPRLLMSDPVDPDESKLSDYLKGRGELSSSAAWISPSGNTHFLPYEDTQHGVTSGYALGKNLDEMLSSGWIRWRSGWNGYGSSNVQFGKLPSPKQLRTLEKMHDGGEFYWDHDSNFDGRSLASLRKYINVGGDPTKMGKMPTNMREFLSEGNGHTEPVTGQPIAHMVLGGSGVGKSHYAKKISNEFGCKLIDADEIKKALPGAELMDPQELHGKGINATDKAIKSSIANRENVVIPMTGANMWRLEDTLHALNDAGYHVTGSFVHAPMNVAINRIAKRVSDGGHDVPRYVIEDTHDQAFDNLKQMARYGLVHKTRWIDNSQDVELSDGTGSTRPATYEDIPAETFHPGIKAKGIMIKIRPGGVEATKNGRHVGFVNFINGDDKSYSLGTAVSGRYQRKGVATAMYNAADAHLKSIGRLPLSPATSMTDDGFAFWSRRDPSSVAHHLRNIESSLVGKKAASDYGEGVITSAHENGVMIQRPNGNTAPVSRKSLIEQGILDEFRDTHPALFLSESGSVATLYHASPQSEFGESWRDGTYFADNPRTAHYYASSHHEEPLLVHKVNLPSDSFRKLSGGRYILTRPVPVSGSIVGQVGSDEYGAKFDPETKQWTNLAEPGPIEPSWKREQGTLMNDKDTWHQDSHPITKNDDGTPKVFYHGAKKAGFDQFKLMPGTRFSMSPYDSEPQPYAAHPQAHFFADDPEVASKYLGKTGDDDPEPGSAIYPVHLRIKNPLDLRGQNGPYGLDFMRELHDKLGLDDFDDSSDTLNEEDVWQWLDNEDLTNKLRDAGYDGVAFYDRTRGDDGQMGWASSYAVFDPHQIKSAMASHVTDDPKLNMSEPGSPHAMTQELYNEHPLWHDGFSWDGGVGRDGVFTLHNIRTEPDKRFQGRATAFMRSLTRLADKHNTPVELEVGPGEDAPEGWDLANFYMNHGFNWTGDGPTMRREPNHNVDLSEGVTYEHQVNPMDDDDDSVYHGLRGAVHHAIYANLNGKRIGYARFVDLTNVDPSELAEQNERDYGYLYGDDPDVKHVLDNPPPVHAYSMGLDHEHRGKGIGTGMVKKMFEVADSLGYDGVSKDPRGMTPEGNRAHNSGARAFRDGKVMDLSELVELVDPQKPQGVGGLAPDESTPGDTNGMGSINKDSMRRPAAGPATGGATPLKKPKKGLRKLQMIGF